MLTYSLNAFHCKFLILFQYEHLIRNPSGLFIVSVNAFTQHRREFVEWVEIETIVFLNGSAFLCHVQKGSLFVYKWKKKVTKKYIRDMSHIWESVFIFEKEDPFNHR